MNEGGGQVQPSFHAAGIGADEPVHGIADVYQVLQLPDAYLCLPSRQPEQARLQPQELPAGLLVIESGVLEGGAYAHPHLLGPIHHVEPGDEGSPGGWQQQGREHAHDGGLASPVRPKKAVYLAFGDGQVDAVDRPDLAEVTYQPLCENRPAVQTVAQDSAASLAASV